MPLDLADLELAGMTGTLTAAELAALDTDDDDEAAAAPATAALTQRVTVTMDDGTEYAATLDARDRRAYALHRDRYKLPPFTVMPNDPAPDLLLLELLTVFSAWHATRHRLKLHRLDWPAFSAHAVDVAVTPGAQDPVPHPPGRGAG